MTADGPRSRAAAIWTAAVFLAAFGLHLWQLAPGVFWLDSSELAATARCAGVPHPPGTPLFQALAHLATLLPVGSVALRVNLLAAVLGAGAAALVFLAARSLLARIRPPVALTDGVAALLALTLALSRAAWFQAVRAEVYTLHYLLVAAAVLLALRWERDGEDGRGHVPLAGLVLAAGLANHHYLILLTLPAFLVLLLGRPEGRRWLAPRRLAAVLGLPAAALLLYAWLPLRGEAAADLAWGDATSVAGFLEMVSARAFHLAVTEMPRAPFPEACATILGSWVDLLGPLLFFGGLLGLAAWTWRAPRLGGFLGLLVVAGVVSKAIMYLDVENPDDHGYFFTGLQALTLSATGVLWLLEPLARRLPVAARRPGASAALALLLLAGAAAAEAGIRFDRDRRVLGLGDFHVPDALHRSFLGELPPDAVLLPSYYAVFFNHVYQRAAEQRRPDVSLVHQSFFRRIEDGRPYEARLRTGAPDLEALLDAARFSGSFPWEELLATAARRPVILETDVLSLAAEDPLRDLLSLGEGGLEIPFQHTRFTGPGLQVSPGPVSHRSGGTAPAAARFWQRFYRALAGDRMHPEARKILLWIHYRDALYFARTGQWEEAGLEAGLARRLAPDQPRLHALEAVTDVHRGRSGRPAGDVDILHAP